jgi:hypothetical protein
MLKQCTQCAKVGAGPLPRTAFNKCARHKDGLQPLCREHQRERLRAYYKKSSRKYNEQKKVWRKNNPKAARLVEVRRDIKAKYGLTQAQYVAMYQSQAGRCAICETPVVDQFDKERAQIGKAEPTLARVDHCHSTNAIRGLLCFNCNIGLGKFRDDPKILLAAARYLQETATAKVVSRPRDEKSERDDEPQNAGPLVEQRRGNRRDELNPFLN